MQNISFTKKELNYSGNGGFNATINQALPQGANYDNKFTKILRNSKTIKG